MDCSRLASLLSTSGVGGECSVLQYQTVIDGSLSSFQWMYQRLRLVEIYMDGEAQLIQWRAWIKGLWKRGFEGAYRARAGLEL